MTGPMKIITEPHDLTRTIHPYMTVYPNDPEPKFEPFSTIKENKVGITRIILGSHSGTHVDAQRHFLSKGKGVDKEPLAKFIGEAIIIDASSRHGEGLSAEDLKVRADHAAKGDILLLYTGEGNSRTNFT